MGHKTIVLGYKSEGPTQAWVALDRGSPYPVNSPWKAFHFTDVADAERFANRYVGSDIDQVPHMYEATEQDRPVPVVPKFQIFMIGAKGDRKILGESASIGAVFNYVGVNLETLQYMMPNETLEIRRVQ
jgi:hypothetical protein